jgi:hypothetical protein
MLSRVLTMTVVIGMILVTWAGLGLRGAAAGYGAGGGMGGGGYGGGGGGTGQSTLAFDPGSLTVAQGETGDARVMVTLASGRSWGTNLKVLEAPRGITVTFAPSAGEPTFESKMRIRVSAGVAPGAYTVRLQATGDDPSSVVSFQVIVTKGSSGGY